MEVRADSKSIRSIDIYRFDSDRRPRSSDRKHHTTHTHGPCTYHHNRTPNPKPNTGRRPGLCAPGGAGPLPRPTTTGQQQQQQQHWGAAAQWERGGRRWRPRHAAVGGRWGGGGAGGSGVRGWFFGGVLFVGCLCKGMDIAHTTTSKQPTYNTDPLAARSMGSTGRGRFKMWGSRAEAAAPRRQ